MTITIDKWNRDLPGRMEAKSHLRACTSICTSIQQSREKSGYGQVEQEKTRGIHRKTC